MTKERQTPFQVHYKIKSCNLQQLQAEYQSQLMI